MRQHGSHGRRRWLGQWSILRKRIRQLLQPMSLPSATLRSQPTLLLVTDKVRVEACTKVAGLERPEKSAALHLTRVLLWRPQQCFSLPTLGNHISVTIIIQQYASLSRAIQRRLCCGPLHPRMLLKSDFAAALLS